MVRPARGTRYGRLTSQPAGRRLLFTVLIDSRVAIDSQRSPIDDRETDPWAWSTVNVANSCNMEAQRGVGPVFRERSSAWRSRDVISGQ